MRSKLIALVAALGVALLVLAGTAEATHVSTTISVPAEATVGQPATVQAALLFAADGRPAAGTSVVFYADAAFADVDGKVELGRAVTDENGIAKLTYEPRMAGDHEIMAEFTLPGETEPEVATTAVSVTGGSQLHQSTAGVSIPGLNVWLLIALVGAVWAILLSVALRVIAIAHNGSNGGADTTTGVL